MAIRPSNSLEPIFHAILVLVYALPTSVLADADTNKTATSVVTSDNGYSGCPCIGIDPFWQQSQATSTNNSITCTLPDGKFGTLITTTNEREVSTMCLPQGVGISCNGWFNNTTSQCTGKVSEEIETCVLEWCFVDPEQCEHRSHSEFGKVMEAVLNNEVVVGGSSSTFYGNNGNGTDNAHVSFDTCGNLNYYREASKMRTMANQTIRVAYPEDSDDLFMLYTSDNGVKTGSTVQFMLDIGRTLNLTYEAQAISQASLDRYPNNTYDACTHDVALGHVDLCIGPFWILPHRTFLAQFTPDFADDALVLVVQNIRESYWMDNLQAPFMPFTWHAWLFILLALAYMSFSITLIQDVRKNRAASEAIMGSPSQTKQRPAALLVAKTAYISVYSFTSNGFNKGPKAVVSLPEKVIAVGFMMFIFFVCRLYQAGASANIIATESLRYTSLEDITSAGGLICMVNGTKETFYNYLNRTYGSYLDVDEIITHETKEDVLENLRYGECNGFITIGTIDNVMKREIPDYCKTFTTIGPELGVIGNAFPVSGKYADIMSFAINKGALTGMIQKYHDRFHGEQFSKILSECEGKRNSSGSAQRDERILIFPLICTLSATSVGLLIFSSNKWMRRSKEKLLLAATQGDEGLNPDQELSDNRTKLVSKRKRSSMRERSSSIRHSFHLSKDVSNGYLLYLRKGGIVNDAGVLESFLKTMPKKELIALAKDVILEKKKLLPALNKLPDSSPLIDLLCYERCSHVCQTKLRLRGLSIDDLLHTAHVVVEKIPNHKDSELIMDALAADNPRKALAEYIMSDPALSKEALDWKNIKDGLSKRRTRMRKMFSSIEDTHDDFKLGVPPKASGKDEESFRFGRRLTSTGSRQLQISNDANDAELAIDSLSSSRHLRSSIGNFAVGTPEEEDESEMFDKESETSDKSYELVA